MLLQPKNYLKYGINLRRVSLKSDMDLKLERLMSSLFHLTMIDGKNEFSEELSFIFNWEILR